MLKEYFELMNQRETFKSFMRKESLDNLDGFKKLEERAKDVKKRVEEKIGGLMDEFPDPGSNKFDELIELLEFKKFIEYLW